MSFKVSLITNTSTRSILVAADARRTHWDLYNESGEDVRYGDKSLTNAAGAGQVLQNKQHLEVDKSNGRDPTSERWIIGSAGGSLTLVEEWV